MTYAVDPTYDDPNHGWTIQVQRVRMEPLPATVGRMKLEGPGQMSLAEPVVREAVVMARTSTPKPRTRRR